MKQESEAELLRLLQQVIRDEVFVTSAEQQIITPNLEQLKQRWLFDFRKTILQSRYLDAIATLFWDTYKGKSQFQVAGLEVAAIPLIAAVVMKGAERGTPVNGFFIRKSRKKYGLLNAVEGTVTDDPIILVDDIINSGKSFMQQLAVINDLEKVVSDIFVLLRFRDQSYYQFAQEHNITITNLFSLTDFEIPLITNQKEQPPQHFPFDLLWRFESDNPSLFHVVPKSAPVPYKDMVYFGSDQGVFWALKQTDGSVVWKYKVGSQSKGKGIFSTPAIHQDIAYFGAYDGNVYALDTQTGERKWTHMEADWVGSSPTISVKHNLLYIGLEFELPSRRGSLVALDLTTGEKQWEYSVVGYTHCSPAYSSTYDVVAVGSNDAAAYLFSAKTGELLWKYETSGEIKGAPAFDDKRGRVLFASFDGRLYIFDVPTGKLVHAFSAEFGFYSIPLIHDDCVYIASFDKKVYAINLDTFALVWEFTTRARVFASPVIIDNRLYVGANDARLYELDVVSGKEVSVYQVSERITNRIAYNPDTKQIFLPTYANELYAIQRRVDGAYTQIN